MNIKLFIIVSLLAISAIAVCQTASDINKTDLQGKKQGRWIKKYPNNAVMYDGIFKDDHPVGEFKRFNDNNSLKSVLIYSEDGKEAYATLFHDNGYISSKGKYVNQKKEGKWQFFSQFVKGYLVCEEFYTGNLRNGLSLKLYPDSTIAEKISFINDIREGEWIQNYPNGAKCLRSNYLNGQVYGKFEFWFDNGKLQFSGFYKKDARDGQWLIYNYDGTIKYKIEYLNGYTKDRQLDIDESDRLDSLEKNKGKIADPEKSGYIIK